MPTVFTEYGVFAVVLTLAGAWLADSGAYFAGTFFGKTKLCPVISPKKTVEGLIGGTVCNGVFLLIIAGVYNSLINKDVHVNLIAVFIAGMLCSVIGLVGDLGASVIKRQAGIKDYGNIMPGHGGIMDRFDSVLTVTPFMFWMFTSGLLVTMK
jgi:phosphatidate cytidylyltransferase